MREIFDNDHLNLPDWAAWLILLTRDDYRNHTNLIQELFFSIEDYNRLFYLIRAHRLVVPVYSRLKKISWEMPGLFFRKLEAAYRKHKFTSLSKTSDLIHLTRLFREASIPLIVLKGPALSMILYEEVTHREFRDLDLLIGPNHLNRALELLYNRGYVSELQDVSDFQWKYYMRNFQEILLTHPGSKSQVELHWRLFGNYLLFEEDLPGLINRPSFVKIGEDAIPTLKGAELAIYLLVHGSLHMWYRLFWLKDVSVLLSGFKPEEWEELYARAREKKIVRLVLSGIRLSAEYYGVDVPGNIFQLSNDSKTRLLCKMVRTTIHAGPEWMQSRGWQRFRRLWYMINLKDDLNYKIRCIRRTGTNPGDWKILQLPDKLFFLYFILRPFTWILSRRKTIRKDNKRTKR
ncbi:MAG: nucleotidyltransferase family protein [Bacteroidales bacterium]